ncbi:hypothetical protein RU639_003147 [Aspergillus parasiticus]
MSIQRVLNTLLCISDTVDTVAYFYTPIYTRLSAPNHLCLKENREKRANSPDRRFLFRIPLFRNQSDETNHHGKQGR